jgi:hypothetical protein
MILMDFPPITVDLPLDLAARDANLELHQGGVDVYAPPDLKFLEGSHLEERFFSKKKSALSALLDNTSLF